MKISTIIGKSIILRDVCEDDAEFILSLRLDKSLGRFMSQTDSNLNRQIEWIKQYKKRFNEYYFIIESNGGIPYGTVRVYDIRGNSFTFGSWITRRDAPAFVAIKAYFLINDVFFCKLRFKKAHFDTKRRNIKLLNFFKRLGGIRVSEDIERVYFNLTYEQYERSKEKYHRFVSERVKILEEI